MKKRVLSLVTALALCLSMLPAGALALEPEENTGLCPHHTEHTAECGYAAPTDGDGEIDHAADCAYAPAVEGQPCQHEHDGACGYEAAEPGQPCGYECRICPVQELIDALPDAGDITAENAEDVAEQLDAISTLWAELTDEETEQVDSSRYAEAIAAMDALAGTPEASVPELLTESVTETYVPDADSLPDNDELFAGYAMRTLYGESGIAMLGNYGESALSGLDAKIYAALKEKVAEVAAGTAVSTSFLLTWEELDITQTTWTQGELETDIIVDGAISSTAVQEVMGKIGYDPDRVSTIIDCLLADCPYEMYWFNKTQGYQYPTGLSVSAQSGSSDATISLKGDGITISFAVASAYAGSEDYTTDTTKTGAASAAAATAQSVVSANASESDYNKLLAYKTYICDAVSYNTEAADKSTSTPYGDPWQLIYVFDGDAGTNVVCEGYAKAFQYLCDLSGLTCYTVTGTMTGGTGAGAHMWNIVTLEGQNYLVDVTNSDTGTVGAYGGLFLAGAPNGSATGYIIEIPAHDLGNNSSTVAASITFTYDADTIDLYGSNILTLATADYTEPEPEPDPVAHVEIDGQTAQTYATIEAAFAAVQSGDTATITLLRDAPVESGNITVNGDVTLEGDGHTLSGAYTSYTDGLLNIPSGAKLTIYIGLQRSRKTPTANRPRINEVVKRSHHFL